jgi:hypothetical protein
VVLIGMLGVLGCGGGGGSEADAVDGGADHAGDDLGGDATEVATDGVDAEAEVPPGCGNAVLDLGEACDGSDLGEYDTCDDFPGFVAGGTLQCRPDCSGYLLAGCTAGATTTLGSCELTAVQAAVDAAVPGETIALPACDVVWNGTLDIAAQPIVVRGQGPGNTVLRAGTAEFLLRVAPAEDTPVRISGLTLDLQDTGEGILLNGAYDVPSPLVAKTKVRIDHNEFRNAADSSLQALRNLGLRGVVDHNVFRDVDYPIRPDSSYRCGGEWWDNWGFAFGAARDNMYFEDNEFTGFTSCVSDCQYANRYAFRYNLMRPAGDLWPMFDLHGNWPQDTGCDGCGAFSCFGGEIYGNHIVAPSNHVRLIDQRGGKMLVFGNLLDVGSADLQIREEYADSLCATSNPLPQHVSDSYFWNNRVAGEDVPAHITTDCSLCVENGLAEDVDLFNFEPAFDGTSGVGCGPLADRPASCTPGVGYWATTQPCDAVDPATVGPQPPTPVSGTLFRCTAADTWTTFYVPLVHPHPLVVD